MTHHQGLPYEETAEKHFRLISIAALVGCPTYLLSAAHKIGIEMGGFTRVAEIALGITVMLIVVPICFWDLKRMESRNKKKFFKMEGFVFDIVKRSIVLSWLVTFFFTVGLKMVVKNLFTGVPTGFFLELVIAVMLGVFGATFFILNRDTESDSLKESWTDS